MLQHHTTRHRVKLWLLALPLALSTSCLLATAAPAGDARVPSFAKGEPRAITELPPGQLRETLEKLLPAARERALKHLQGFSFPGNDVANLHADPRGDIFYVDPAVEGAGTESAEPVTAEAFNLTSQNVFTLHSKPGAARVVYLDLDGHTVSGTVWNSSAGTDPLYMLPFNTDSDPSTFSASELSAIAEIWKRVSEDLAPFDIDVTTEQPTSFGPNVGHILVSPVFDANGRPIYSDGYGGVAYVNVWGRSNFPYYQPALVFPDNLGYSPHNVAEAASHELGHNLGLSHDGTSTKGYYAGHGSGLTSWAPIMGVGYYSQVTQWSKGEYPDANNGQDDLAIITSMLTYRSDDHEDLDALKATPLVRSGETQIGSTTSVTDPDNLNPANKGIIEDQGDVDLFYVDVGAGTINLTVTPAWREEFSTSDSKRGMNIDLSVTLMDETGGYITHANPADETSATIVATVGSGRYILAIEGTGFGNPPADGYSPYGSIGQYFISGTVPAEVTTTFPPQAPNDLTASLAVANTIALGWTDPASTPETNESSYRIFRQKNGGTQQLLATLPKDSTGYNDNNLASGSYIYFLEAFNSAGANFSNATAPLVVDVPSTATAFSEQTLMGLVVAGSYANTAVENGFERLSEAHQGGKPTTRVSRLDHVWTITGVEAGAKTTLQLIAEAGANSENDDFAFAFSLDNGLSYTPIGVIENGGGRHTLSVVLPPGTTGTVLVKVTDTNTISGNGAADILDVHYLAITSEGDPGDMPPTVSIEAPDGIAFPLNKVVTLFGEANDNEDGSLSADLTWNCSTDGKIGTGASIAWTPAAPGIHVITATATDSAGLTGGATVNITVTDPNGPSSMAVFSLAGETVTTKSKWNAMVTTTVTDNLGNPVDGATVTGTWSGGATGSGSCITAAGQCTISRTNLSRTAYSITFGINGLSHATLTDATTENWTTTINKP